MIQGYRNGEAIPEDSDGVRNAHIYLPEKMQLVKMKLRTSKEVIDKPRHCPVLETKEGQVSKRARKKPDSVVQKF
jgi:hypothetical protein